MNTIDTKKYYIKGRIYRVYMNRIHKLFINTNINYLPIILKNNYNLPPSYEDTLRNINYQNELPIYSRHNIDHIYYTWMNDS